MSKDDPAIHERLASKGWEALRPTFETMHRCLLSLHDNVTSQLTTIYVKYTYPDQVFGKVFAVIWVRTIKEITVGLVLPPTLTDPRLFPPPGKYRYPPLNAFFAVTPGQVLPPDFAAWARQAYDYRHLLPD